MTVPFRRVLAWATGLLLVATAAACEAGPAPAREASASAPASGATATSAPAATAAHVPTVQQLVDSSLREFRRGLPAVARLQGGASDRETLVRQAVDAIAARDTVALHALLVTRAEFAWLYFPDAPLARPPYGIDPTFLWLQVGSNSARDLPRAFAAVSAEARYAGLHCPGAPEREGANRLHARCLAVVAHGARRDTLSLFGSILERDGRFKLLSYANGL